MLREIVLDTETTGLDAKGDDRLVEIGCVELVNRMPSTDNEFHVYINPERDMPAAAEAVHGLSSEFLSDKPKFAEIADAFLDYIGDDLLVIHNASFDVGFLNAELERANKATIQTARVLDTLALARRKHPGGQNSLDALCKRYGIDNSNRVKHGALLDSWLLADVYLELIGERQASLGLSASTSSQDEAQTTGTAEIRARKSKARQRPKPLPNVLTDDVVTAHRKFVATLGTEALWRKYLDEDIDSIN